MAKFTCLIHESVNILRMYRNLQINHLRVINDRIHNRKKYFEITAFLNFECGASRLGYLNENLNFTGLDFPRSIGRKAGISKYVFFSVNYPIIYNTTKLSINCEAGELSLGYFLSSRERLNVVDIIIIIILIYTYIIIS